MAHDTVGAIIWKDGKLLILDRAQPPKGYACPAGHLKAGEDALEGLKREIKEETGLDLIWAKKIGEETLENNPCKEGENTHHWQVFLCETRGKLKKSDEAISLDWYSKDKLKTINFEYSWEYWLKSFEII